jgi:hypothetical protein
VASTVAFDPLPLYVRRARKAGIAARTCGHVFPLTSFYYVVSAGLREQIDQGLPVRAIHAP